jgi:hypothetical protein
MNRHGIKTTQRVISFLSFKGNNKKSSLDQVTLPPAMGLNGLGGAMYHRFGEWLKRNGYGWEYAEDEKICKWATEFWNASLSSGDLPRRFDRMALKNEFPQ